MFRINSRFVRQAIATLALTVGLSTVSFAQTATSSTTTTAPTTTQTNSVAQALINFAACGGAYCQGGGRVAM
jgi:hypothetical protein